jgi:hypothetical protein
MIEFAAHIASTICIETPPDQVIDRDEAISLQRDTAAETDLAAWVVTGDAGTVIARFTTSSPTHYVLQADDLPALRAMLPAGLERFDRSPNDPPAVHEIWFLASD